MLRVCVHTLAHEHEYSWPRMARRGYAEIRLQYSRTDCEIVTEQHTPDRPFPPYPTRRSTNAVRAAGEGDGGAGGWAQTREWKQCVQPIIQCD